MLKLIVIVSLFASLSIAMTPKKVRLECGTKEGPRGPPGPPGKRGPGGIAPLEDLFGVCRCQGNKGDPGVIGLTGEPGTPGEPGEPGRDAPIGPQGFKGMKGEPGVGSPGVAGLPGTNGRPGSKGEPGEEGFGFAGEKGDRGDDGPPGNQGLKGEKGGSAGIPTNLEEQVARLTARVNALDEALRNGQSVVAEPVGVNTEETTTSSQCRTTILQFPRASPSNYIECSDVLPDIQVGTFCLTLRRPSRGTTAIFHYQTDEEQFAYSLHLSQRTTTTLTFTVMGQSIAITVDQFFAINSDELVCAWFDSLAGTAGIYTNADEDEIQTYNGALPRGPGEMVFGQLFNSMNRSLRFFTSFSFSGTISNFAVYPRVLSLDEAHEIRNCQCPLRKLPFCSDPSRLTANSAATINPSNLC